MLTTNFGRKIPETKTEFWELYKAGELHFVPMRDTQHKFIDVPSYEVVAMLLKGYNIETGYPIISENKDFAC